MQISRRGALLGATAAAVVTGAATAPLAIKAAGVKAALAGAPDARILVLVEEHDRTLAAQNKAGARWFEAVMERMPPHLRHVELFGHRGRDIPWDAWHAILEICKYPEVQALRVVEDRLKERCHDLEGRLTQTEAMTLEGVCAKFRIAKPLRYRTDDDLGDSAIADVERLAGEPRS